MSQAAPEAHAPDTDRVADDVLSLVVASVPGYRVTPARHDAMVTLLRSLVRTLALESGS